MYIIAVCDDDEATAMRVKGMIREWDPQAEVDCYGSGEALLEHYRPYHAVFLDIDMGRMDGIETGKRIRKIDRETKIIYLTAYRDYAAGAFGVHAFQYLLKPVNQKGLWKVLDEVFRYVGNPQRKTVLDFYTADGLVCLAAEEIYFFAYADRKIRIVADKEYFMAGRIGKVYERVKALGFSMPHKSFVVNMIHVKNVRNQQIYMDNGMEVPLSQKKLKSWKEELTAYLSARLAEEVEK